MFIIVGVAVALIAAVVLFFISTALGGGGGSSPHTTVVVAADDIGIRQTIGSGDLITKSVGSDAKTACSMNSI